MTEDIKELWWAVALFVAFYLLALMPGCTDDRPLTQQEQAEQIIHHIIEQTRKATRATCLALGDEDAGPNVRAACKRALAGEGE